MVLSAPGSPGVYRAQREHVLFHELPHLRTREVAEVLTRATVRIAKYLRRRELLEANDDEVLDGLAALAASPRVGPDAARGCCVRPSRKRGSCAAPTVW